MKKQILIILFALGILNACDSEVITNGTKIVQQFQKDNPNTINEKIAPKQNELGFEVVPTLPEYVQNATAKTFKSPIQYTPNKSIKTYYYNAQGELADKPQTSGFYREILGKTADGRTVAQDFYQDSQLVQTAPFIFKKGADETSFDGENMDGEGVWFTPNGSLESYQPNHKFVIQYHNGQLLSQMNISQNAIVFYHDNGKNIMAHMKKHEDGSTLTFFREDGSAIAQFGSKSGQSTPKFAWDNQGKPVSIDDVRDELVPIVQRYQGYTDFH